MSDVLQEAAPGPFIPRGPNVLKIDSNSAASVIIIHLYLYFDHNSDLNASFYVVFVFK